MKSFIFHGSYCEAVQDCDEDTQKNIYYHIINYIMLGKEPDYTKMNKEEKMAFTLIKPILSKTKTQSENGKKGGAPKGNTNAKKNNLKQPKNNPKTTQIKTEKGRENKEKVTQEQNNLKQPKNKLYIKDKELIGFIPINDKEINDNKSFIELKKEFFNDREKKEQKEKTTSKISLNQEKSIEQQKFEDNFPDKSVPIAIEIEQDIDIDRLIKAIKQSEFLCFAKNLKFDWCLKHYTQIIEGQYKDYKKSDPMLLPEKHTPEELASLIIPIDEIEI